MCLRAVAHLLSVADHSAGSVPCAAADVNTWFAYAVQIGAVIVLFFDKIHIAQQFAQRRLVVLVDRGAIRPAHAAGLAGQ